MFFLVYGASVVLSVLYWILLSLLEPPAQWRYPAGVISTFQSMGEKAQSMVDPAQFDMEPLFRFASVIVMIVVQYLFIRIVLRFGWQGMVALVTLLVAMSALSL